MKRLRRSLALTLRRWGLRPKDGKTPLPDGAPKSPKQEADRNQIDNYAATIGKYVESPLRDLTKQIGTLIQRIDANAQVEQSSEQEHHDQQLALQKCARTILIVSSFATFVLSFLTLLVLIKTYGVYRKLETNALEERAAILDVLVSNGPVVVLTNSGQTEATDVLIRVAQYEFGGPRGTPFSVFQRLLSQKPPVIDLSYLERSIHPIGPDDPPSIKELFEQENRDTRDEIADLQNSNDIEIQSSRVREEFFKWGRPDLDFAMQAPVLPPDSAFRRWEQVSERQRAEQIEALKKDRKMGFLNADKIIATISSAVVPGNHDQGGRPDGANYKDYVRIE
jgi:hypothetical protein